MQTTHAEQAATTLQAAYYPQWVIVTDAGTDSEDIWNDHYTFKAAVKELTNCGGAENGFDLMKRLPDGTLTTEF